MNRPSVSASPDASRVMGEAVAIFETVWGWMGMVASENRAEISAIVLPQASRRALEAILRRDSSGVRDKPRVSLPTPLLREARRQVVEFLSGQRRVLDFPIDLSSGTSFQRKVWRVAQRIPYGRARSYKWIAARVGGTHCARAVGSALGANPLPLIIPCHRVVAHDGSLGGFAYGLKAKRRLLDLEGTLAQLSRKVGKVRKA